MRQYFKETPKKIGFVIVVISMCLIITACSDNPVESDTFGTLTIGVSSGLSLGGQIPQQSPSVDAVISNITITSAKITIGRIRFKSVDDLDSLDFRSDVPMIVDLQLDTSVQNIGSMSIPPGTYDETRFRIEKVTDSDSLVYNNNPDMRDLSIRVAGYLNGELDSVFVWTGDFMEDQVHEFEPFTIGAGETVNLVFEFDKSNWFSDGAGGYYDPRESLSSGSIQSDIENNIKAAFKVVQR